MAEAIDERRLVNLVTSEFENAQGAPGGEISSERADAWAFYMSRHLGNEVEGESQVVSSDVADVVDGIMPSLLRLFTTADNLIAFEPVNDDDVDQAAQESDYVNHVFWKRCDGFMTLYTWFFDALVQKNGIVKAWWTDEKRVTTEEYSRLTETELLRLTGEEDEDESIEIVDQDSFMGNTVSEDDASTIEARLHNVKLERTSTRGRIRIEAVPPEEYRISSDARSLKPDEARMVGHERDVKRHELVDMGFDKETVDKLPAEEPLHHTEEELVRYDKSDYTREADKTKGQDSIKLREAYMRLDMEGNGKTKLWQVITANNQLLHKEPCDRQPFHVISPQPLPHKHFGRATAEKVIDVQRVTTTLTREILNNLYHSNKPGHAISEEGIGENTIDDLLTTRIGRVARFRGDVSRAWQPMTVPYMADRNFPMLEYYDKVKRDRTGVNPDSEGLSPEQLKNIQSSVLSQANDLSRMKIEAICRIFAETGIKSLFQHIHELILKNRDKKDVVQLRGDFVEVDPRQWRNRESLTVQIGLGIGSRDQNLIHLDQIWQKQQAMVEAGGMNLTVSPRNIYNTAIEMARNAQLPNPERFFVDPGDQRAPPPNQEQIELQQQQAELAERQQRLDEQRQEQERQRLMMEEERKRIEMTQSHQIELEKLQQQREQSQQQLFIKMEEISNQLTKFDLEYGQRAVPGSRLSDQQGRQAQQQGGQGNPGGGQGGPEQQ